MKNIFKKIFSAVTATMMIASIFCMNASAATNFHSRSDFIWGVNGHNQTYKSYPARSLEQQIKLAAELGVKYYRFNFNAKSNNDFTYLDNVVNTAARYGLKLMLVCDDNGMDPNTTATFYSNIAKRYGDKIPYIQVFNEMDVYFMTGNASGGGNGDTSKGYDTSRMADMLPKFKAAVNAVHQTAPNMKVVINISYRHTYLFTWLKENGVDWDITGVDWYKNMGFESGFTTGGYDYIIPRLQAFGKDIIICETNIWPQNASQSDDYYSDVQYLPGSMEYVYNNYPSVKGMFFYELLDEPAYQLQDGKYNPESHFGLVEVSSRDFSIGEVKPIYTAIQKLLGGGTVTPSQGGNTTTSSSTTQSTHSSVTSSNHTANSSVDSAVSVNEISDVSDEELLEETSSDETSSEESKKDKDSAKKDEEETSSKLPIIIGICVAAVLVIGGGTTGFILWKRKKNAALNTELADDAIDTNIDESEENSSEDNNSEDTDKEN